MVVAVIILAQAIALDSESGVWFPPDGWRDQYIERRRSYSKDLQDAFARDPKLAKTVCTAVAATSKPAPSVNASLRQMRSVLDMLCVAMNIQERDRPAQEARAGKVDALLSKRLDEAVTAVEAVAPNERKATQRALLATIDSMSPGAERLAAIFRAIVLRPQDARGAWLLLRASRDTDALNTTVESRELALFVERLYRSRAAAIGPDALNWEDGLPEVLLYLGKDEEARHLQTDLVARARNDIADYDRIELAVLDEIAGRSGAVREAFSQCRDAQACHDSVWSFATRTAEARTQNAPRVIGDLLEMTLPWYADWSVRFYTTRLLMRFSPSRARQEITAMYATQNLPDGVMLDLVLLDAQLASTENDHLRTIALRDCWLNLLGVRLAPFPADGWARLAALEEPKGGERTGEDCSASEEDGGMIFSGCTLRTLIDRLHAAVAAKETGLARDSMEKIVAHTLAAKMRPYFARRSLITLAQYIRREVSAEEAARIVRYLDRQPLDPVTKALLNDFREGLPQPNEVVVLEPWDTSEVEPNRLSSICH